MNSIPRDLGKWGADTITTTAATSGTWYAIQSMWSATVFAVLTEANGVMVGTVASLCLFGNQTIYGAFTNITLTSGAVRCYRTRDLTANPAV